MFALVLPFRSSHVPRYRRRSVMVVTAFIACAVFAACSGTKSNGPTTPTTPTATITALAISAPPAFMKAGDTSQLTATATLRDDDNALLWSAITGWQGGASKTLSLEGGRRYTLKINDCFGETRNPTMYGYALVAVHP